MRIFLPGAGGFIGRHLIEKILANDATQDMEIVAFDLNLAGIKKFEGNSRITMHQGDIFKEDAWLDEQVAACDVCLPFAGVAKPAMYLERPLWTFELDFEQNLKLVRMCVKHGKRVIFPSTSEVYGLASDNVLLEDETPLITGPIKKMRWIYSCGKQMMDRVITAYGFERGLKYTLFRPFNWIGPDLDTEADAQAHKARSITQILYDILHRGMVTLVGGGSQRRSFTWIGDGTDALVKIIRNENGCADGEIFNLGNPGNNYSMREMTEIILDVMKDSGNKRFADAANKVQILSVAPEKYYSSTYDDTQNRVPSIEKANRILAWQPKVSLRDAIKMTLDALSF